MTDIRSEGQDYLYISSDYQPKNRQEATIWWMKCFAGQFLLLSLKTDNFYERLEQADISFNQLDPLLKWDNDTLFNVLLNKECYSQATRFIHQMSNQAHFDDMLNLTNPKAGIAIQKLFDYAADEKIPPCMKNEHEAARKQKLRQALCEVVSPAYIAQLTGKTGETDFSAALKLKMTAPSVIIPVLEKLRNASQDEILKALRANDTETNQLIKKQINRQAATYNAPLTDELQFLLTARNFLALQGQHMDSYSDWELAQEMLEDEALSDRNSNYSPQATKINTNTPSAADETLFRLFYRKGKEK